MLSEGKIALVIGSARNRGLAIAGGFARGGTKVIVRSPHLKDGRKVSRTIDGVEPDFLGGGPSC